MKIGATMNVPVWPTFTVTGGDNGAAPTAPGGAAAGALPAEDLATGTSLVAGAPARHALRSSSTVTIANSCRVAIASLHTPPTTTVTRPSTRARPRRLRHVRSRGSTAASD